MWPHKDYLLPPVTSAFFFYNKIFLLYFNIVIMPLNAKLFSMSSPFADSTIHILDFTANGNISYRTAEVLTCLSRNEDRIRVELKP